MPSLGITFCLCLLCWAVVVAEQAAAHTVGLTDTAIELAQPGVRIVQTLPAEELAELDLPIGVVDAGERYLAEVVAGWRISAAGTLCKLAEATVRELRALDAWQFEMHLSCEDMSGMVEVQYLLADGLEPSHVNLARVHVGRYQLPFRFTRERSVLRLPLEVLLTRGRVSLPESLRTDDLNAGVAAAKGQGADPVGPDVPTVTMEDHGALRTTAAIYLPSGIRHILAGPDHLAFVLALVLVPMPLGRLLFAITLFTLAHSITLGLSYFQILSLAPSVTEPLIALSVAAIGVENLLVHRHPAALRMREVTVFLFGLVHGVGLSYQLGALPTQSQTDALLRLLMFNLGVECGQMAALVLPGFLLMWAVRQPFGRHVTVAGSLALVTLGIVWFVGRAGV